MKPGEKQGMISWSYKAMIRTLSSWLHGFLLNQASPGSGAA